MRTGADYYKEKLYELLAKEYNCSPDSFCQGENRINPEFATVRKRT